MRGGVFFSCGPSFNEDVMRFDMMSPVVWCSQESLLQGLSFYHSRQGSVSYPTLHYPTLQGQIDPSRSLNAAATAIGCCNALHCVSHYIMLYHVLIK